jgi:hypothetical protein
MSVCERGDLPVFCCDTPMCAGNDLCQFPDGNYSQCMGGPDGGVRRTVDGGVAAGCADVTCVRGLAGSALCKLACGDPAADCVRTGGIEHCMP